MTRRAKLEAEASAEAGADLPYTVTVEPQDDGQGICYVPSVIELLDLFVTAATREEAVAELESAKNDLIEEYLRLGNEMPAPLKSRKDSGKMIVRMPPALHETPTRLADTEGVSFNQYMVSALARCAGWHEATASPTGNRIHG